MYTIPIIMPGEVQWVCQLSLSIYSHANKFLALQCLPVLLVLIMLFFMPESPRWLLMNDRYEEAKRILLQLHTPEEAEVELAQISNQMQIDRTLPNSYWIMFKKPSYRKRSLLGIGTTCAIQFSGILVINSMCSSVKEKECPTT